MSRLRRLRDPVFLLVGAAVAWGIGLLVLAGVVPVVTRQSPPGTGSATVTASGTVVTTTPVAGPAVSEQARITLVRDSGYRVLGLRRTTDGRRADRRPAAVAAEGHSGGSSSTSVAAWVLSALVLLAGIVGFVTILIGVAIVPVGVLLLLACIQAALSSGSAPGRRAAPSDAGA